MREEQKKLSGIHENERRAKKVIRNPREWEKSKKSYPESMQPAYTSKKDKQSRKLFI